MNGIDRETTVFWRHPCFADLCLLKARFTHHRYELHTHPTYVIAIITQGCERLHIGTRLVTAPVGTVLLVHPEECHDGEAGADGGWAYRTLYPSVALMTDIAQELGCAGPPVFGKSLIDDPVLVGALVAAHEQAESGDEDESAMLTALRHLILRHADKSRGTEPISHSGSRRRLGVYLDAIDAGGRIDLRRFADLAGVTRFQVIRDFKHMTGLTPGGFIRNRRLRLASGLLRQGVTIAEAALAAGFADQSHLTRACRSTLGITPTMFRRAYS